MRPNSLKMLVEFKHLSSKLIKKREKRLDEVPHAYISATQEAKIGRITVQGQPRQKKVSETPISTNKPGVMACAYNPSYAGGMVRRIGYCSQKAQDLT
jgi:hypothetical protein